MPSVDIKRDPSPFAPVALAISRWLIRRLPIRVTPNQVTVSGFLAQVAAGGMLYLASYDKLWFAPAGLLLIFHWLADTVDGDLAVARGLRSDRGFFLDLYLDMAGLAAVMLGIAFASYGSLPIYAVYEVLILLRALLVVHQIMFLHQFIIPFPSAAEAPFAVIGLAILTTLHDGALISVGGVPLTWFAVGGLVFALSSTLELVRAFFAFVRQLEPAKVIDD